MYVRLDIDSQIATVLENLTGPGATPISDMDPAVTRGAVERFATKWNLTPRPLIGAVENRGIGS